MKYNEAYQAVKKQHPNTIILIRLGDFYEAFGADARTVSHACDIVLASRLINDKRVEMAGFPSFSSDAHVAELIKAGHKVGLIENRGGYWVDEMERARVVKEKRSNSQ